MQNRFPIWKNVLIIVVFLIAALYALPNFYGADPSVQISPLRNSNIDQTTVGEVENLLSNAGISFKQGALENDRVLVRFDNTESQLEAADLLRSKMEKGYSVALNLAPATPSWLAALGGDPMYLGLDLRGGVHFLLKVDMEAALNQAVERYAGDIRSLLRSEKIRYVAVSRKGDSIKVKFKDSETVENAERVIRREFRELVLRSDTDELELSAALSDTERKEIRKFAIAQNMTTLRNRVNELGVAEPLVQQQGAERIVVQLPGVQDTARAKEILGATATLAFRLADVEHDVQKAVDSHAPIGTRLYYQRNGQPILLKRRVIVTGDQIVDASSGLDPQSGSPAVYVTLDGVGAKKMGKITQKNIGKPMAVVFIENKVESRIVKGEKIRVKKKTEEVINVATIRDAFSKRFQITGLDSTQEARNLALLLRAGALAAPIEIVEERTVGPSLGQDNIDKGMLSVIVGLIVVLLFMGGYYKVFGVIADCALIINIVLIVSVLSMLQATLTLPGIAGIVLTVGMAVDANVLIFERIREELKNGNSPQASIFSGYEKAFFTILDANITTLIAAIILFGFGTGPIKGFAITLSIGILTSMFTAILGTRMMVNIIYGERRISKLSI